MTYCVIVSFLENVTLVYFNGAYCLMLGL